MSIENDWAFGCNCGEKFTTLGAYRDHKDKCGSDREVYCELGQRILNLVGVDDDLKNVLIDLLEKIGSKS